MSHRPFVLERKTHRPAKFAERVKEELSELIPGSLKDPRLHGGLMITITSVEVSPDLKHAQIQFGLMGQTEKAEGVEEALNQASAFIRRELMRRLTSKVTPQLHFKFDQGLEYSAEIHALMVNL